MIWFIKIRPLKHKYIKMSPSYSNIFGNFIWIIKNFNDINNKIYNEFKILNFPKLIAIAWWRRGGYGILLNDPKLIKYIFNDNFNYFIKGYKIEEELYEMLGNGIFTSDPPKWKFHRKAASKMFSMRNLKTYMFECTINQCNLVFNKMDSIISDSNYSDNIGINIYDILSRFTLDTFTGTYINYNICFCIYI